MTEAEARRLLESQDCRAPFLAEREGVEKGRFRLEEGGADAKYDDLEDLRGYEAQFQLNLTPEQALAEGKKIGYGLEPWEKRHMALNVVLRGHLKGAGMPSISECIREAKLIEAYLFGD